MSASRIAVLCPRRRVSIASKEVTRDLPTPPLPLTTAITFLTLEYWLTGSIKLCGAVRSPQLEEQLLQSWLHDSLMAVSPSFILWNIVASSCA